MCFLLIDYDEQKVIDADAGVGFITNLQNQNDEFEQYLGENEVIGVDVSFESASAFRNVVPKSYGRCIFQQRCEVKTTTKWWSGYWYLWWLLIALALFILLCSITFIIVICYMWEK
jgi:hypothetical protein